MESSEPYLGPPRNAEEQQWLLSNRPPGWEYLLFGGVLRQRLTQLQLKSRQHELRLGARNRSYATRDEVVGRVSASFARLGALVIPVERVLDQLSEAFGAPGEPGDSEHIVQLAEWLMDTYEDILDLAAELRALDAPSEFAETLELAAQSADRPLASIREFVVKVVAETERIPDFFALSEEKRQEQPLQIEATLVLEADSALMEQVVDELRRAVDEYDR